MVQHLGLAGTLQTLQAVADKSGFSLGKLFEDSEALTGIAALSAQQWGRYATILDDVRTGTDATNQAFDRWKVSAQGVKDTYDATLKQVAIEFGSDLAPMLALAVVAPVVAPYIVGAMGITAASVGAIGVSIATSLVSTGIMVGGALLISAFVGTGATSRAISATSSTDESPTWSDAPNPVTEGGPCVMSSG